MRITRTLLLALLAGLLMIGCSPSEETDQGEKPEETAVADATGDGLTINYTLVVSGLPMMGDMTFNYQLSTNGKVGKMTSESIIPAGEEVRTSKLAYVTDVEAGVQTYINEVTKTYASLDIPDPSETPPSTSPQSEVSVEPTGNTQTLLGVECREIDVSLEVSREGEAGAVTTTMNGKLWVSSDFEGYGLYKSFHKATQEAISQTRLQGSGYFEFLSRSGFSRESLNTLYNEIGAFPLAGTLELDINQGSSRPANMTTKLDVTSISSDPIAQSSFMVPDDYTEVEIGQVLRPGN
jgi:hypothetical protein